MVSYFTAGEQDYLAAGSLQSSAGAYKPETAT